MTNRYICLSFVFLIFACEKNYSSSRAAIRQSNNSQIDSSANNLTDSIVPNGFYINNNYRNRIDSYKSIFNTDRPYGPITLTIKGNNANLYYDDGIIELKYKILKEFKQLESSKECLAMNLNDSLILFWDGTSRTAHEYINSRYLKGEVNNLIQFYQEHLFNGNYTCEESMLCNDNVEIKANVIKGLKGGPYKFDFRISWNDNFPRMDYLIFNDSIGFNYSTSFGDLILTELVIPDGCNNILDTQCPIYDVKMGKHVIRLKRIES